jgi:HK97 family phage prohead protease
MGIDVANFNKNPIFLWGHDGYGGFFGVPQMDHVLGRVENIKVTRDAFDIDVQFADAATNPKADQAFRMVKAGFLNTTSIGFIPRQIVENVNGEEDDIPEITKSELLEISLVPIPSNPDALALSRSMMDYDLRSTESAQMGWVCRHGTFYANPAQAESCHGHDRSTPPAQAAATGVLAVRDALRSAVGEFDVRSLFGK